MLFLEGQDTCRGDAVEGCVEEDDTAVVRHTGNLPRSHLARLVALVDNRISDDKAPSRLPRLGEGVVSGKLLTDAILHSWRHLASHHKTTVVLLDLIFALVELRYGGPVPFLLRTRPEGTAEGFRRRLLRDNFLVFVFQRHDLSAFRGIDGHGNVTGLELTAVLLGAEVVELLETMLVNDLFQAAVGIIANGTLVVEHHQLAILLGVRMPIGQAIDIRIAVVRKLCPHAAHRVGQTQVGLSRLRQLVGGMMKCVEAELQFVTVDAAFVDGRAPGEHVHVKRS